MRYKLVISYDGAYFNGYQRQIGLPTVQGKIEDTLKIIFKEDITIKSAGRTDTGVHAIHQVAHFDSEVEIPLKGLKKVLNKSLTPHIYIKDIEIVDTDFHSRLSAKKKEYRYYISTNEFNPIKSQYIYYYDKQMNLDKLKEAMKCFIGTKDFKSLSKGHDKEDTIRTIELFEVNETNGIYEFRIIGNGFLRNMVRIIMAILIKVNENKIDIKDVEDIINSKERKKAPWLAPGVGLYLYNIEY